ncbi:MAG: hypothetical protein HN348_02450 [Proteobacteria bacterium]|jgi:hypothetical protein|nr:hypothetical protein [Pseudomonadota bacterium]
MPGYDLLNEQCTMEDGPMVVPPEEADYLLQMQDAEGNAALVDGCCGPTCEAQPVESEGPDFWDSIDETVDGVGTARNRLGLIRDVATFGRDAAMTGETIFDSPVRGADPTGGRMDGAARGLSLAGGVMRTGRGLHDLHTGLQEDAPVSELLHASRDTVSGSGWIASGLGQSEAGQGLSAASNTIRIAEGISEFAEGADTFEEQHAATDDIVHGTVNLALTTRPELRRAYALGNDVGDRGEDYMSREGSLVGDSALLGRNSDGSSRNWSDWAADSAVDADRAVAEATGSEGLGTAAGLATCAGTSIVATGGALVTGIAGYATDAYDAVTSW